MSLTEDFLTQAEEQKVVEAILTAEKQTSGEIRVHIEEHSDVEVIKRAQQIFYQLEMQNTSARNGVLFYIGVRDRSFAIIGDSGIDQVVPADFWECTKDLVIQHFKNKKFSQGLQEGVLRAGEQLKQFFPVTGENRDELPNEITRS